MKKYRKKPVVVEAAQLTVENVLEVYNWISGVGCTLAHGEITRITIKTLEGDKTAIPGDWIIKGVRGEFYPCKPDIFEMTYEEIVDE